MSKSKNITWEEYYKLPLNLAYGYAFARNHTMALTFNRDIPDDIARSIVDAINGVSEYKIPTLTNDGVDFSDGLVELFCVRGWGGLIGIGGLNLSEEKAVKIQDGFVDYIIKQLT